MISPIFFIFGMLHPPMELFTGEEYWGPRVPRGGAVGVQKFGGGLKGHIFHGLDFPLVLERDIRNSGLVHTRQ